MIFKRIPFCTGHLNYLDLIFTIDFYKMMSKRLKLDQVINLLDDITSSDDEVDKQDDVISSDSDDDVPLSVLMARKNHSSLAQNQPVLKKIDHDISTESSDDDVPLSALAARKTIRKPFQQKDINIQTQPNVKLKLVKDSEAAKRKSSASAQRRVNTYLRGLFDSIELESDEEDECKENTKSALFKSDSPVLNYDRSVTRFVLSLKNSKRKSTT